jgi:pimeloyl-ACP methyl ester carboxylesterase
MECAAAGSTAGIDPLVPKAPLDFRALIEEPTAAGSYRKLDFPTLILRGQHAPLPTRMIARGLASLLPANRLITIKGAGHMGSVHRTRPRFPR